MKRVKHTIETEEFFYILKCKELGHGCSGSEIREVQDLMEDARSYDQSWDCGLGCVAGGVG